MKRPELETLRRAWVPAAAFATIASALLWERGAIPWVPFISELAGLGAILLAPGIAAEPAFRGGRWTPVERLGFAAVLSIAWTALAGVGLHLVSLPISTATILLILLVVSAVLGIVSLPHRTRPLSVNASSAMRVDVIAGVASLALLAAAFIAVLVAHASPAQPPLEVALVDDAGSLIAFPLRMDEHDRTHLNVAVRSLSGATSNATVSIVGDGLRPWTTGGVFPTSTWSVVEVPVVPLRTGIILPTLEVRGGGVDLRLPLEIEVGR